MFSTNVHTPSPIARIIPAEGIAAERSFRSTINTENFPLTRLRRIDISGRLPLATSSGVPQRSGRLCSASKRTTTANEGKHAIGPRPPGSTQDREQVSALDHRHAGRPQAAHRLNAYGRHLQPRLHRRGRRPLPARRAPRDRTTPNHRYTAHRASRLAGLPFLCAELTSKSAK